MRYVTPSSTTLDTRYVTANLAAVTVFIIILMIHSSGIKTFNQCASSDYLRTLIANGLSVEFACIAASAGSLVIQILRIIFYEAARARRETRMAAWSLCTLYCLNFFAQYASFSRAESSFVSQSISPLFAEWATSVPLLSYLTNNLNVDGPIDGEENYTSTVLLALSGILPIIYGNTVDRPNFKMAMILLWSGIQIYSITLASSNKKRRDVRQREIEESPTELESKLQFKQQFLRWMLICGLGTNAALSIFFFAGILDTAFQLTIRAVFHLVYFQIFSSLVLDAHSEVLTPEFTKLIREQRANKARRAFLRYVFHEVRVPLNSISMGLHILMGSADRSKDDEDTIHMMKEATAFMTETLNDVSSVQKIEEGRLELSFQKAPVRGILSTVELSLKGALQAKAIKLVVKIEGPTPKFILADRFRLEHVLANFVSNAIKFSPSESEITLAVRADAKDHSRLTFSVRDQGVGISPENQKKLFTPYMQINANELQQGNGTGIGLAICREIVTMHGGIIGVKSTPNMSDGNERSGSEFYFTIPFTIIDDGPEAEVSDEVDEVVLQPTIEPPWSSKLRLAPVPNDEDVTVSLHPQLGTLLVLIVDDVLSNRKMLKILLDKKGIASETVDDGQQAVNAIKANPGKYNLIFMDSMMPVLDGIGATKRLREELHYSNIIIGLTGNAMDEDVREFMSAGVDLVLSKPLRIHLLKSLLLYIVQYGTQTTTKFRLSENLLDPSPGPIPVEGIS